MTTFTKEDSADTVGTSMKLSVAGSTTTTERTILFGERPSYQVIDWAGRRNSRTWKARIPTGRHARELGLRAVQMIQVQALYDTFAELKQGMIVRAMRKRMQKKTTASNERLN